MTLSEQFGVEGLMLDDRIPAGVLEARGAGPERTALVDVLVETTISAEQGDSTSALMVAALHAAFNTNDQARLRAVLERRKTESKRIGVLLDFVEGRIGAKKAEALFQRLRCVSFCGTPVWIAVKGAGV